MDEKQRILLVDDTPANIKILNSLLTGEFSISIATNGADALKLAHSENSPDLILLDIMMPDMDGYEVCRQLQTAPDTSSIPIIFISGLQDAEDKVNAFAVGGVDYVTKPFQATEILARIRTHLSLRKMRQQLEELVAERTQDLQQSEEKLRAIVENMDALVLTCDDDFRITYANSALQRYSGGEAEGRFCHEVLFGNAADNPWSEDVIAKGQVSSQELKNPKDGRWYHTIHSLIKIHNNQASEKQIILHDITERKQALQDLQEREEYLRKENIRLRATLSDHYRFGDIVGKSKPMQQVYEAILDAAGTSASVIIYGESGTGKELVAKAIHENSDRKDQPLIYVNCGAIPENLIESEFFGYTKGAFTGATGDKVGYLELADGGTLFLDEIGEIPLNTQVKLLRAIEGNGFRPVGGSNLKNPDFRIIAATNRDLKVLVRKGRMRQDFLYRIHIIPIYLPPLRERREDIRLLIEYFMGQHDKEKIPSLPEPLRKAMLNYDWPGNVRELQNTIQRFVSIGKLDFMNMDIAGIPEHDNVADISVATENRSFQDIVEEFEKKILLKTLQECGWHQGKTAELLQLPPRTLYRKMKKLGVEKHSK